MAKQTKITIPANLPADAIGFIATRTDRSERLALYLRDGSLNSTFAAGQIVDDIAPGLLAAGYVVRDGFVFAA